MFILLYIFFTESNNLSNRLKMDKKVIQAAEDSKVSLLYNVLKIQNASFMKLKDFKHNFIILTQFC